MSVVLKTYVCGCLFRRRMLFEQAGDRIDGHAHNFDHDTMVHRGAVEVTAKAADGTPLGTVVVRATDDQPWVQIKAGVEHTLVALEPSLAFCEYANRDERAEIAQEYTGWTPGHT